ncbi:MAG: sensor histidine kinase [Flavobacteriaceae bacterium]|nr:sensor histidine kinase [Flavobacteriaceae bacterium]
MKLMFEQNKTTELLIISTTLIVLLLTITLIFLFLFIQKKKKIHYRDREKQKKKYARELASSQNEIREKALENISWEIHDNVGQLLSVAKMHLNRLETKVAKKNQKDLHEVIGLISKSLQDLRALSKSLNPVSIQKIGLLKALHLEVDRYNRLNFIKAKIKTINKPFILDKEKETILFRIVQEFIHNSVKHSKGSELTVTLFYNKEDLEITIKDNGIGFLVDKESTKKGIGLLNMKGRAELIKALFSITSTNKGTTGYIKCNKEKVI